MEHFLQPSVLDVSKEVEKSNSAVCNAKRNPDINDGIYQLQNVSERDLLDELEKVGKGFEKLLNSRTHEINYLKEVLDINEDLNEKYINKIFPLKSSNSNLYKNKVLNSHPFTTKQTVPGNVPLVRYETLQRSHFALNQRAEKLEEKVIKLENEIKNHNKANITLAERCEHLQSLNTE